jgi:glucose/arabinose dehydrogenase
MSIHRSASRASRVVHRLATLIVLAACGDAATGPRVADVPILTIEPVATGFTRPVFVGAPVGDSRLFVVERAGLVRIVKDGVIQPRPFLDLQSVVSTVGGERGMLSIAFHPRFAFNRYVYVNYVATDGNITIVRYTASAADPDIADPASATPVRRIPHAGVQHYGGMMQFLTDGTLLISVGDAGTGDVNGGDSQRPGTLRGKLVRIDVDRGERFAIPADNPFVGVPDYRPEVFALGLRNPWRFWFDAPSGQLFIADVGEASYEELNIVSLTDAAGSNFGWSFREGPLCLPTSVRCDVPRLQEPDVSYAHGPGCNSITGGVVYRGGLHTEHLGRYFYADFCKGWVRSLRGTDGTFAEPIEWTLTTPLQQVTSFGVDGRGEMHVVTYQGDLMRIGGGSR